MKQKNNVSSSFLLIFAIAMVTATLAKPGQAQFTTPSLTVGDPAGSSNGFATVSSSGTTVGGYTRFSGGATPSSTYYAGISSHNASVSTLVGGYVNNFYALNTSTVNVNSGGNVGHLVLDDNSTGIINAGGSAGLVRGLGGSIIVVNGGDLDTIDVLGTSTAEIYSGTIASLYTDYFGTATIHGGDFYSLVANDASAIDVYGGNFLYLSTYFASSTINLYGQGLTLDSSGFVTGSLQDGQIINAQYEYQSGHLNLINSQPVPELSGATSFGLMLTSSIGILVWRSSKGRKKIA